MKITTLRCLPSAAGMFIVVSILAGLAGPMRADAAGKSPHPELQLRPLIGAKVRLCQGFAENSLDYFMQTRMPKEYAVYSRLRANEFEVEQAESLRSQALQKMRDEAAVEFDPDLVYEAANRLAYLSVYQFDAGGFEVRLPSGSNISTTPFTRTDGRRELIDLPKLFGLKDLLDSGPGEKQALSVHYAYTPSDSDALRLGADSPGAIFIKMEEKRARQIVSESQDAPSRRILADIYVRIEKCELEKPTRYKLTGRVLGFNLHTAKLGQSFFETEESWKRVSLITRWRSPDWPGP